MTMSRLSLVAFYSALKPEIENGCLYRFNPFQLGASLNGRRCVTSVRSVTSLSDNVEKPTLQGVVFDMDGTLTKPNLDFGLMYERCGVDPSRDILEEIETMSKSKRKMAVDIIEEMEEEGRRTLELMPGAMDVIQWLSSNQIPMALVTRNTAKTANVLTNRLLPLECRFQYVITRDYYSIGSSEIPPKPDPQALRLIAEDWKIPLPSKSIVMVGDSFSNDIVFGNNAGVTTVLLDTSNNYHQSTRNKSHIDNQSISPDIVVNNLSTLPDEFGSLFSIHGIC